MYVDRTCTQISKGANGRTPIKPQPLSAYKEVAAYVLLGDPGAGKTTAFIREAELDDGFYVTARDLTTYEDREEWHHKTLFIDGLDEIRAGSSDGRRPLDAIRNRLQKLGQPRFRLSCREADWFGETDKGSLRSISQDDDIRVLRLDPLTEGNVRAILGGDSRVKDSEEFMQQAQSKGLSELLFNPQVLELLVTAIKGDEWPGTRKETFELACKTLVRNRNREHGDASRTRPTNDEEQLQAAGFLCAVQLIAGTAGYSLTPDVASNDFPYLNELNHPDVGKFHAVVHTNLFKAPADGREGHVIAIHRYVSEYVAARYLAKRVDHEGFPIGRLLALTTGEDGIVVSELRGLSAWLAALCESQRGAIIDRDPLGVVLYGDVQSFAPIEKRRVLDGLRVEAKRYPWFRSADWTASPFGALATETMEDEFRTILATPNRSETDQAVAECVLDAMTYGVAFPDLAEMLLDVVRDSTWWPRVRHQGLIVLHRKTSDTTLITLLDEIRQGMVEDSDDGLIGYLLTALYPTTVTAAEVLNYLHAPSQRNLIGSYLTFWTYELIGKSSDQDLRTLLDQLVERKKILKPILHDHYFRRFAIGILSRGLEVFGESIGSDRLYDWLGVVLDEGGYAPTPRDLTTEIRRWLEARPAIQTSVLDICLDRCTEAEYVVLCINKARGRLFQASLPVDYARWCFDKMQAATNDDVARYLLDEAVKSVKDDNYHGDLAMDEIYEVADGHPEYGSWLRDILTLQTYPEEEEFSRKQRVREAEGRKEKQKWLDSVRVHENDLREGRGPAGLLRDLGMTYFGHYIDSDGSNPKDRLDNFLGHDSGLVTAAFDGLRRSIERDDIPSVTQILNLHGQNQHYLVGQAYLAGLREATQDSPEHIHRLNDEKIKRGVAFRLTEGSGEDPDWYKALLASRPDLVAEVLTAYAIQSFRFRKKEQHVTGIYELAYSDSYAPVARIASVELLKAFPIRCTNQQLRSLDSLLKAAMSHAHKPAFQQLIEDKLRRRSMNVGQRVRWLGAGLLLVPEEYLDMLTDCVNGREQRVLHLTSFLVDDHGREWLNDLPTPAMGRLVRLVGRFIPPHVPRSGFVTPEMSTADFLDDIIRRLSSDPSKEATDVLEELWATAELSPWHERLKRARFEQRATRREADFQHPDVHQVIETLNNQSPSNAADLAALTVTLLEKLADRIRNDNTDDYRQFWNEGPQRQLEEPKHEEACRDALLSDLKQTLEPLHVLAEPEAHYADDKRADIRVSFGGSAGCQVPIEIKKNSHRDLWRAIRDQLIDKYSRDPGAAGFGIYLVFWFGAGRTQPSPNGPRPRTPAELRERLEETLSFDENRTISIRVFDVTEPQR